MTNVLSEKKKIGQIKGLISNMLLIILYTVQHSTQYDYQTAPNFKILSQVVPE